MEPAVASVPSTPVISLRPLARPADDAPMNDLANASREADGDGYSTTLGQFVAHYDHLVNCDPARDIVVAEVAAADGPRIAGYGRVWVSHELGGADVIWTVGHVHPSARRRGVGRSILEWQERRAREIAAELPVAAGGTFLQAEANVSSPGRVALLENAGYRPVRWSIGMVRPTLDDAPGTSGEARQAPEPGAPSARPGEGGNSAESATGSESGTAAESGRPTQSFGLAAPMPAGLEIREVRPEHLRAIWEAEVEAFRDSWGSREGTEEDFQTFLEDPVQGDSSLWRVAWDGDQVAGMVRSFINADENERFGRRRGYVESISVRRPWRRRGLARALIAASFPLLRARGMTEGALGVDAENPNGALGLYQSVGFIEETRVGIWRKAL